MLPGILRQIINPIYNNTFVNLYIDDYISIYLYYTTNSIHDTTRYYNIITNTFDLFYKKASTLMPNSLQWNCALSLHKLRREESPAEIKKILN